MGGFHLVDLIITELKDHILGHLICNHFSKWFEKNGSRKVVREKWFEKSGSRKVVRQTQIFFQVREKWLTGKKGGFIH